LIILINQIIIILISLKNKKMSKSVPNLINYVNFLRARVTDLHTSYKELKCDYKLLAKENEVLREDNRKLRDWIPHDTLLITAHSQTRGNLSWTPDVWPPVKKAMRVITYPLPGDPKLPRYDKDFTVTEWSNGLVLKYPERWPNYNMEDHWKDD
jgi:regulator of replication initiation timing